MCTRTAVFQPESQAACSISLAPVTDRVWQTWNLTHSADLHYTLHLFFPPIMSEKCLSAFVIIFLSLAPGPQIHPLIVTLFRLHVFAFFFFFCVPKEMFWNFSQMREFQVKHHGTNVTGDKMPLTHTHCVYLSKYCIYICENSLNWNWFTWSVLKTNTM